MWDLRRPVTGLLHSIRRHPRLGLTGGLVLCLLTVWLARPPRILDRIAWSPVVTAQNGELVGARRAVDGQWRFAPSRSLPATYVEAVLAFEDQRFFHHPGVDFLALARAIRTNLTRGCVVSGGSTITMQLIRLSRPPGQRTMGRKVQEALQAIHLELWTSKKTILSWYAALAPFGGNIVGLETASWRYFGRPPAAISWAEAATLAVLPNEPGLVYPGRHYNRLLARRDRVLHRLHATRKIDAMQLASALAEPLVTVARSFPDLAPHLTDRITRDAASRLRIRDATVSSRIETTLDMALQERVTSIALHHHRNLSALGIHNVGVVVAEVNSGAVRAYVGNMPPPLHGGGANGSSVDMVMGVRSTGSVLKPMLFAAMLDEGELLPTTLVADIPTTIGGYSPQNFDRDYQGAVPASVALARSLNIPAVRMLAQYGVERFHLLARRLGMTTLTRSAQHYGISLILGGAEGTLWDLAGIYASLARAVTLYPDTAFLAPLHYRSGPVSGRSVVPVSPGACWAMLMAMQEVNRPGEESTWREFTSARRIAWKTGTSFGFRDAWAIGVTPQTVIAVWVGNASGEGQAGLIGMEKAAPVLFDILNVLPSQGWFEAPEADLQAVTVCAASGFQPGRFCEKCDTILAPVKGLRTPSCPYHWRVHLDQSGLYRVSTDCADVHTMQSRSWFVLPPAVEYYYRRRHAGYQLLPPQHPRCRSIRAHDAVAIIYPPPGARIYVPAEVGGNRGKAVLQATHRDPQGVIFWHLDNSYLGSTQGLHQMAVDPQPGLHRLVLVDQEGERIEQEFEVL